MIPTMNEPTLQRVADAVGVGLLAFELYWSFPGGPNIRRRSSGDAELTAARAKVVAYLHDVEGMSFPQIASGMGSKTHTTPHYLYHLARHFGWRAERTDDDGAEDAAVPQCEARRHGDAGLDRGDCGDEAEREGSGERVQPAACGEGTGSDADDPAD